MFLRNRLMTSAANFAPEDDRGAVAAEIADAVAEPIAAAVADADAATEAAEQIAAAAMDTIRGREIADIAREVDECRTALTELPGLLATQVAETLNAFRSEVTAAMEASRADSLAAVADALASLTAPSPPASAPPILTEPPPAEVSLAEVTPPPPEPAAVAPPERQRKNRFV